MNSNIIQFKLQTILELISNAIGSIYHDSRPRILAIWLTCDHFLKNVGTIDRTTSKIYQTNFHSMNLFSFSFYSQCPKKLPRKSPSTLFTRVRTRFCLSLSLVYRCWRLTKKEGSIRTFDLCDPRHIASVVPINTWAKKHEKPQYFTKT
jgi:hypothetical protein